MSATGPAAMQKATRSIVCCLLLLALAEVSLRAWESTGKKQIPVLLPTSRQLLFNLGTSKTRRGVSPILIDSLLTSRGVDSTWCANIIDFGATSVGLYKQYMWQIHQWASTTEPSGNVAIEVRGPGLNDHYVSDEEIRFLEKTGIVRDLLSGKANSAARKMLSSSRLSSSGELFAKKRKRDRRVNDPDTMDLMSYLEKTKSWSGGERGWVSSDKRTGDPTPEKEKTRYEDVYLKDFSLGGVQTEYLVKLIRQVRQDGFTPILYLLPVTEVNRGYFPEGTYEKLLDHISLIADREKVLFVDLDSNHNIDLELFEDSHHLKTRGAREFSPLFAELVHFTSMQSSR